MRNLLHKNPGKGGLALLVFLGLVLAGPAGGAAKREGAKISVALSRVGVMEGELLAAQSGRLLVANPGTMNSLEIPFGEIIRVRVTRKALFLTGVSAASSAEPRSGTRVHIGIAPSLFSSTVARHLVDSFRAAGFGDDLPLWAGAGSPYIQEYPRICVDESRTLYNLRLDVSLTSRWSIGFHFSPLGLHRVEGSRVLRGLDYRPGVNVDNLIRGEFQGRAYFLTAGYFPVPYGSPGPWTVGLGLGLGLTAADVIFQEIDGFIPESGPGGGLVRKSCLGPGGLAFFEVQYFLHRNLSLGLVADYKVLPLAAGPVALRIGRAYYATGAPLYVYRRDSEVVSLPDRIWDLGGFSVGLELRVHL